MKWRQKELNIFDALFNMEPAHVPDSRQPAFIELRSSNEIRAWYNSIPPLELFKLYATPEDSPILRRHATEVNVSTVSASSQK